MERLSDQATGLWLGPRERAAQGAILYLHGGAFCVHLPSLYREFCFDLAQRTGVPVLLPDYRLVDHRYFVDDDSFIMWSVFTGTANDGTTIKLAGDSAGGNLALALLHRSGASAADARRRVLLSR